MDICIVHVTPYTANNTKRFHGLLHKRLDEVFQLATPRKTVVLALDGPAPLAKLLTQRCVGLYERGGMYCICMGDKYVFQLVYV